MLAQLNRKMDEQKKEDMNRKMDEHKEYMIRKVDQQIRKMDLQEEDLVEGMEDRGELDLGGTKERMERKQKKTW